MFKQKISEINYLEIIKKAFFLTWKNRYLWWLGFFLAFSGGAQIFNYSFGEREEEISWEQLHNYFVVHSNWLIPLLISASIFLIIFSLLAIISRAGIIKAVQKEEKKEIFGFKTAFLFGKKHLWNFLFLQIILSFSLAIIISVIVIPIGLLFSNHSYYAGGFLLVLGLLIIVPLVITFSFLRIFGQNYLVLGKLSLKNSLESAYSLFQKNWIPSLIMTIFFIPLGLAFVFSLIAILIFIILLFGIIGFILFLLFGLVGALVATIIGGIIFLILVLALNSFYQAFSQVIWTLFFKEIATPKVEEILEELLEETNIETGKVKTGATTSEIK